MNTISWQQTEPVDQIRIYRSRIALHTRPAPFGLVAGDRLVLRISDNRIQQVVFQGDTNDLADVISAQLKNGYAVKSEKDASLFIIAGLQHPPGFIEVLGGTAVQKLGLQLGTTTALSQWELIEAVSPSNQSFIDVDGLPGDLYALTAVTNGVETERTPWMKPLITTDDICILAGKIVGLDGVPMQGLRVEAWPHAGAITTASAMLSPRPVVTFTSQDGRFFLPVLRGVGISIQCESIGEIEHVLTPDQPYMSLPAELWKYYKLSGKLDVDQQLPSGTTQNAGEGGADPHQMPV